MSLRERLAQIEPKQQSFAEWLIALNPDDRTALEIAARNPLISTAKIIAAIVEEGGPNSKDAVSAWRAKIR